MLKTFNGIEWQTFATVEDLTEAMRHITTATDVYADGKYLGTWFPQ